MNKFLDLIENGTIDEWDAIEFLVRNVPESILDDYIENLEEQDLT